MILLVGARETKASKEMLYRLAGNIQAETVLLFLTGKQVEEKHIRRMNGVIAFGDAAIEKVKDLCKETNKPLLKVPSTSALKDMDVEEKKDLWNKIQEFVKLADTPSGKRDITILTPDGTEIIVGETITWDELTAIVKLCDYLKQDKFTVEIRRN